MEKEQWLKWRYEDNAPMALIKAGFNHAWSMSFVILILSISAAIIRLESFEILIYFVVTTVITTLAFMVFATIPLILLHFIQYKIFKKFLLENKFEYVMVIAWSILFFHYISCYYFIDYFIFNLNIPLSTNEYVFLFVGHMIGLMYGFITFQKDFYSNFLTRDSSKTSLKVRFDDEKNYF